MKKIAVIICLVIGLGLSARGESLAFSYGCIQLTGIDIAGDNYVFYASAYIQNGYNCQECAKTDWWWPVGTKYAFWLPKAGNEEIYRHMMMAYLTGRKVFVNATVQPLSYAVGIPCMLRSPFTFSMGNY